MNRRAASRGAARARRVFGIWCAIGAVGCGDALSRPDDAATSARDAVSDTRPPRESRGFALACEDDVQCASEICVRAPALLAGCGAPCQTDVDCEAFGAAAQCVLERVGTSARWTCGTTRSGVLYAGDRCATDAECATNACSESLCRAPCASDADCLPGWTCGSYSTAGVTVRACRAAPIVRRTLERYALFDGPIGSDSATRELSVIVPPDAVSLGLIAQDLDGPQTLASVYRLRAPDDSTLVDGMSWNGVMDQPVREQIGVLEINTAMVPSSDLLRPVPGRYAAALALINPPGGLPHGTRRRLRGTLWIKRAPGGIQRDGELHLRVHLVGAPGGVTADAAATNERLQGAIAGAAAIYASSGVRLRIDGYLDLSGDEGARLSTIDSEAEFQDLLASSDASSGEAVDLFVVAAIAEGAGLEGAIGVAGDILGPPGIHGTAHSGVVVAWDTTSGGAVDLLPQVIAHEVGHYLGLWHVREQAPACTTALGADCAPFGGVDPISDTPADRTGARPYLMNWFTDGSNTRVSVGQGLVLRASPLVR